MLFHYFVSFRNAAVTVLDLLVPAAALLLHAHRCVLGGTSTFTLISRVHIVCVYSYYPFKFLVKVYMFELINLHVHVRVYTYMYIRTCTGIYMSYTVMVSVHHTKTVLCNNVGCFAVASMFRRYLS